MNKILITLGILFFLGIYIARITVGVQFNRHCTGYLERAANANTVETAIVELQKTTKYLEDNNITTGYTSLLWTTPDEDIAFWYNNLKQSEQELLKVDSSTTALEKTNILMKLRETLIENSGKSGDILTKPDGISVYPNNWIWTILLSLGFVIIVWIILYIKN